LKELGEVRLGWKYSRYDVSFSILFFTLHIPYTHAHLTTYCLRCPWYILYTVRGTQNWRLGRFRASASIFRLMWISLLHNFVKRVRNRTARFRCVFCITDGYEVWKI